MQDAAIPISVATASDLSRAGISNVDGLNSVSPSLSIANQGRAQRSFFISGVGTVIIQNCVFPYEPEFIDAITLGSKNRFMDNRLQLNLEAFHWSYEDQQLTHIGVTQNGVNVITENVGESTIQGLDVELLFLATASTLLKGNVQFLDSELDTYKFTDGSTSGLEPITSCSTELTGTFPPTTAIFDIRL